MAMTVTIAQDGHGIQGNKRVNRGTLALDTSYPASGYPLTPGQVGMLVIEEFSATPRNGYLFEWDQPTAKVRVYRPNELTTTGSQAPGDPIQVGASNVLGTTTAGNQNVRTRGPVEIAAATDLSAVTGVRWTAKGI